MERMGQELRERQPGGFLVAQHLAHMMLIQALRLPLADGLKGGVRWFSPWRIEGLVGRSTPSHADPAVLDVAQSWRRGPGMSRSSFAQRFGGEGWGGPAGVTDALAHAVGRGQTYPFRRSVSVIALSLGYESESAFGAAFKG